MAGLLDDEELGAFLGNPNIQRQMAKARALAANRDVNTLPDQRTYAAMQGLLGTRPDQMGFSVLNPEYQKIMDVANPAYGLGLAAQLAPILAPLTRGLPIGATIKNVGFDPVKMRTQYPDRLPPVLAFDKQKQKEYLAKQLSPEAKLVQKASTAAQRDIDKGNYTPYFDVSKRFFADPTKYNLQGETLTQALPAKAETIAKYKAMYDTPKSREKLSKAYEAGKLDPNAENWYAMGQLEEEYIKRLGAEKGRLRFKDDFADAMAATTGGADPTSNFLMGSYGNFLRERGTAIPKNAYDLPYPIGGRFASGNMAMYDKVINKGAGLSAKETPKRFDFSGNFLGDMSKATIDEQMMTGIYPGLKAPAGDSYGVAEQVVHDLAAKYGVKPGNFQDVTWKGLKGVPGMPMMEHINQSIERTARITKQTPEEVLDAFIRKRAPMYSAAPFGLLGLTPEEDQ